MDVVRLCCDQLPGVAMLGAGKMSSITYLAHAQQLVELLKDDTDQKSSRQSLRAFLESDAGQNMKKNHGGDLLTAMISGPLIHHVYTHRLNSRGGSSSLFVAVDGIKELVHGLSDADEAAKGRLLETFQVYLNSPAGPFPFSFVPCTPEKCAKDEEDEGAMEQIFTEGCGASAGSQDISDSVKDLQVAIIQGRANLQCLQEVIRTKDERIKIEQERVQMAEEKAQREKQSKEEAVTAAVNASELKAAHAALKAVQQVKEAEVKAAVNAEALRAAQQVKDAEVKAAVNEEARKAADERAAHIERVTDANVRAAVASANAMNEKNMEIVRLQMQLTQFLDKAKVSDTDRGRKRSREGRAAGNVSPVPAPGGSGDPMPAAGDGANDDVPMSQQSDAASAPSPVLPNQGRGAAPGPVRPSQHYMVSPLYGVFDLAPVKWSWDDFKAKRFVELGNDVGGYVVPDGAPRQCRVQPGVIVKFADGIDGSQYREVVKHRAFGFCYRGAPVSRAALEQTTHINAAFGVESGGVQFVCVLLFSLYRRSMALASSVPYLDNMLPRTIALELIPGRDHHITVYKHGVPTTDPVAEVLFDPSLVGWIWRSKRTNGNRAVGGRG